MSSELGWPSISTIRGSGILLMPKAVRLLLLLDLIAEGNGAGLPALFQVASGLISVQPNPSAPAPSADPRQDKSVLQILRISFG